jgi:hypothetical protein
MNFDTIVEESHARLWRDAGKPGQDYLESLGIESQTWLAYKLGYRPDVSVPGTSGKEKAPAIVIPWLASGRPVGVRYRFLPPCKAKFSAETGSSFAGRFFGGQLVAAAAKRRERFLLLVEGEFNCMSIWQACGGTNMPHDVGVDVVSFGHESAKLSPAAIETFRQFYGVFVWANRTEMARGIAAQVPGARVVLSPDGKNANDLLREGVLGKFVVSALAKALDDDLGGLELLLENLYLSAHTLHGLDDSVAEEFQRLAKRLEHSQAALVRVAPDRWLTSERVFWNAAHGAAI